MTGCTQQVLRLSALLIVALVLAGCPPLGTTEFCNATENPITVRWAREQVSVPAGASVPVKSYEFPDEFEVITPRYTWRYVAKFPGHEYMAPRFTFGLRIQPDGSGGQSVNRFTV